MKCILCVIGGVLKMYVVHDFSASGLEIEIQ